MSKPPMSIQKRARELARSGQYIGWRPIAFELQFEPGGPSHQSATINISSNGVYFNSPRFIAPLINPETSAANVPCSNRLPD